jgi:4-amino-4-deoxy-L-arabinose transferase-like glycosyltransferase
MDICTDSLRLNSAVGATGHRTWTELLLLVIALALWFGYDLGARPLWQPDEGRYAEIPREMVASGDYLTPRLNGVRYFEKPPLMYWLQAGAIRLFGLNEAALRLWPALFAVFGCLAVYWVGSRLHGRRAGLLAVGVLATAPLYYFLGHILTLDMALSALLTMALGAFLLGVRAPPGVQRRLLLYTFYVCVALAVLTKGLIGLVLPAMVIGAWIAILGEWRLLREIHLTSGTLLLLAVATPWHVLVAQANPEFARFYFIHEHFQRYLTTVHDRYQPAWYFGPVLFAGLCPWAVFLPHALGDVLADLWRERRRHDDIWFLLLWALLPFAFFSASSSKLIPYILPVVPPLALLLGRWFAAVGERPVTRGRAALVVLLVLSIVLAAAFAFAPELWPTRAMVAQVSSQLGHARYAIAGVLLLSGVLPLVSLRWGAPRAAMAVLFAGAALGVAVFQINLARLDVGRSVKELALSLKRDLRPGDEVMTYGQYYQDLPVYLERRIIVVGWSGELGFGTTLEDTSAWIIDEPAFRRRWLESRTIYLLTNHANYNTLRKQPPGAMCLVGSNQRLAVIVNRECHP